MRSLTMTRILRRVGRTPALLPLLVMVATLVMPGCRGGSGGPVEGAFAPDFVLPTVDGTPRRLSSYRGKVVLLNLWATWCSPCVEEMPTLDGLAAQYEGKGLVVVGVAADEDPAVVKAFAAKARLRFDILMDPGGATGTQYGITGYPETFLIDRQGRLQGKFVGALPRPGSEGSAEWTARLDALLGG